MKSRAPLQGGSAWLIANPAPASPNGLRTPRLGPREDLLRRASFDGGRWPSSWHELRLALRRHPLSDHPRESGPASPPREPSRARGDRHQPGVRHRRQRRRRRRHRRGARDRRGHQRLVSPARRPVRRGHRRRSVRPRWRLRHPRDGRRRRPRARRRGHLRPGRPHRPAGASPTARNAGAAAPMPATDQSESSLSRRVIRDAPAAARRRTARPALP